MDGLKWDEKGLMPAVVQDVNSKDVLMVAYMNNEALDLTIKTKKAHFYSRSRQKLWLKGESSGHTQDVKEIRIDCDNDTILLLVDQKVAACHTGYFSCFYRAWADGWKIVGKKIFDEKDVYGEKKTD
ncbi:MAG: hisI [Deltaproteobacteria bacterium]|nr:hisI [Deltaproteobacteria bacterium]